MAADKRGIAPMTTMMLVGRAGKVGADTEWDVENSIVVVAAGSRPLLLLLLLLLLLGRDMADDRTEAALAVADRPDVVVVIPVDDLVRVVDPSTSRTSNPERMTDDGLPGRAGPRTDPGRSPGLHRSGPLPHRPPPRWEEVGMGWRSG